MDIKRNIDPRRPEILGIFNVFVIWDGAIWLYLFTTKKLKELYWPIPRLRLTTRLVKNL